MPKKTCPHCGKKEIDGRHLNACSKRPDKGLVAPATENVTIKPSTAEKAGVVAVAEKIDDVTKQICPRCGAVAIRLDKYNWRCPVDGDYDAKAPLR
jgi:predicted RNA-binding Zn-ribbon protein involved in translation (DUF1610 family)